MTSSGAAVDTLAMNLVAPEDANGLHIVAGDSLTAASADVATRAAALGLGVPTAL